MSGSKFLAWDLDLYDSETDEPAKVNSSDLCEELGLIEILFTDFSLEPQVSCEYDWVTVLDGDGSTLLAKTCGTNKPAKISSKTNVANIKFHSDISVNAKGFRAEWKAVTKTVPVAGGWGAWGGWTSCSNNK